MTIWKTRSLALAAMLLSGCAPTIYNGEQYGSNAYDNSPYYDQNGGQYDSQYGGQNDQYNDQSNVNVSVSFGSFQRQLAPHGNWTYNARWGDVWRPRAAGFRPYFNGYWANTAEYGVVWVSNDPWGDVTTHYGRWVFDPRDGWLWVPGYVWGPSWVVWRSGGGSIGWFPMPPDDYYGNGPYRGNYASFYGYRDWYGPSFSNDSFFSLWIFVGEDRFSDRNYRNYVMPQRDYGRIIIQTNETTNYVTINNYIVNRSVNVERVERASNRRFEAVAARSVMRRESVVTPVAAGRQIEQRERRERPIPVSANANAGNGDDGRANAVRAREDVRDARQDARDAREDTRDTRGDVRDSRQDTRGAREDVRDSRQDVRDARQNGSLPDVRDARGDVRDARGDVRDSRGDVRDSRENVRDSREDVRDSRQDVRDARQDVRERVQAPQNANGPQQNGNAERNVRNPRENAQGERAVERAERAVERGGNNQNAVQPAAAKPNEAAPVPAGGRAATREEREAERNARREENEQKAAERRRNADR